MSDETAAGSTAAAAAATPKKRAKSTAKKPKTAPTHPKVSEMVNDAIQELKERGGSSLQAIKKHIAANNKVDMDRLTPFVRKYLKSAVAGGTLTQTKGKGANGSFKLSASGQKEPGKAKNARKAGSPVKKAKPAAKKAAAKPKTAEKKKPAAKKPAAKKAVKAKSPKKAAKPSKPKTPKAKKMKSPKKATPKKAKK